MPNSIIDLIVPSILVPYPYAGTHKALKANYLARHQAAMIIDDADLNRNLKEITINLLRDKEKLRAMGTACKELAKPNAAARLAQEILEVKTHGN